MKKMRSRAATILGLLVTVSLAIQGGVDVTTLDYCSFGSYIKLFIILIPAIGGYFSEIKPLSKKDAQ